MHSRYNRVQCLLVINTHKTSTLTVIEYNVIVKVKFLLLVTAGRVQ